MSLLEPQLAPSVEEAQDPRSRSAEAIARLFAIDVPSRVIGVGGHHIQLPGGHLDVSGLTRWLYGILHAGNGAVFAQASSLPDVDFEDEVRQRVDDVGVLVPAVVTRDAAGDIEQVEVHRVRLDASSTIVTEGPDRSYVRLPSLRPRLSPGFFMMVNDRGSFDPALGPLVRYYVGCRDPHEALDQWATAVAALQTTRSSFRTKILSRRAAFPRNDALVFYAQAEDRAVLETLLGVFGETIEGATEGSPLCAALSPALRTADEPFDLRGQPGRSFGEHRCSLMAEAVASSLESPGDTLAEHLRRLCLEANVDPDDVARNRDRNKARMGAG